MKVKDFMTSMLITADSETPIIEAVKLMAAEEVGSLFVCKNEVVVGLVTRSDLVEAQLLSAEVYNTLKLEDVMTSPLVTISPDADLDQTISLMDKTGRKYIPVIQGAEITGIVTSTDVIRVLARVRLVADAVSDEDETEL
jgi:acetoin utilization protein AcuB